MHKNLLFKGAAQNALLRGLGKAGRAVLSTFGPNGSTAMLDRDGDIVITKDGITVLDSIELRDAAEDVAVQILQDAARRTNDDVGDGTTSTVMYACVLAREINRFTVAGHSPFKINSVIEKCEEIIQHLLMDVDEEGKPYMSIPVEDEQDIRDLALLASNGNVAIADMLTEVFINIGQDGTIILEDDKTLGKTHVIYDEGMVLDKGYVSTHFINQDNGTCVLENCKVLICTDRIYGAEQIKNILTEVARKNESLFIIGGDVCEEALQMFILNNQPNDKGNIPLPCCAIRGSGGGARQVEIMRDIAASCGATVVGVHTGLPVNTMNYTDLGTLKKILVKQHSTILVGYNKYLAIVKERINILNHALATMGDDYERERLKERIARITGAIARIKVGAPTELEQKALKGSIEDAVFTVQSGIRSGMIAAAGRTTWEIAVSLKEHYKVCFDIDVLSSVENIAIEIVETALKAPARCLIHKSVKHRARALRAYDISREPLGYDAKNDKIVNLWRHGLIEPAEVVAHSIRNGFSAGRTISTGDCVITQARIIDGLSDTQRASRLWMRNWKHY